MATGLQSFANPFRRTGWTRADPRSYDPAVSDLTPARRTAAVTASVFGPVFALPLLVDPYRWARAFGWRREPETDVGLYFGRCLGALATAACVQAGRAARDPAGQWAFFEFAE